MRPHTSPARLELFVLVALMLAGPVLGQSYGLGDQVLVIGSFEFRPAESMQAFTYTGPDLYLAGAGQYMAPVHLPDGAEVTGMCLYSYDPDASSTDAYLVAQKLPAGGPNPPVYVVLLSGCVEVSDTGYGTVCSSPFAYTVHSYADVDGDGARHLAHFVLITIGTNSRVGGVEITWHRKVSDPPVSPTFADVPSDAFGYAQIEALAASGISGGCGSGIYCPSEPVTRAQLAIFLAKALGLHWPQ